MHTHRLNQHLSDDHLVLTVLGRQESELWEQHLEQCPVCLERAAALTPPDTLLELLASAKTRLKGPTTAELTLGFIDTPGYAATQVYPGSHEHSEASTAPPPELLQHPKYRPLRKLGSGGMGSVWLVEHQVMNRRVAIKSIRPELLSNPAAKDRFLREIRAVAQLQHPNIVTAFDAEETNGACLLVMEYVSGEVLTDVLEFGPLPIDAACRAVRDAALGLHHAHEVGLIHRDVKPNNLIRTPEGVVKVLDFGLVVAGNDAQSGLTGENVVMGTADYIAPEQAENATLADARSDIYSLGCTLYHLLSGRVPFPQESILKKLDAHRAAEPEPIAGVPAGLARILKRMMAKDPAKRFPTALAVAQALEPFCHDPTYVPPRSPSQWRWRTAIAAGLVFAFLGLAAAGVVQYRIQTDRGELVIETVDEDVEVVIKQGGKVVTVYDPKSQQKIILQSGTYEFELNGKPSGLKLDIDQATLKRGDVVIARITRNPVAAGPGNVVAPSPMLDAQQAIKPRLAIRFDPGDQFGTIDISADGRRVIATRTPINLARVYDAATGKMLRELPHASVAKFTPDGNSVVTGDFDTMRVFDIASGKMLRQFGERYHIWNFQPAATGTLLEGHFPRRVQMWDWSTGRKISEFPLISESDRCFLTDDGRYLLRQPYGKPPLEVFDIQTGKASDAFDTVRMVPGLVYKFSPDGKRLTYLNDQEFITYDVATGKETNRFSIRQPLAAAPAAALPKHRFLYPIGDDFMLGVFDIDSGRKFFNLQSPRSLEGRYDYRLSASGTTAVLVIGNTLYFWDLSGPAGRDKPTATPDVNKE